MASVDRQNFDKLKTAYDACMDEENIKETGVEPLADVLHTIAQLFPAEESARQEETALKVQGHPGLANTIIYMSKLGISTIIDLGVSADDKDPVCLIIQRARNR